MRNYTLALLLFSFLFIPTISNAQTQGCLRNGYIYFVLDAEGDLRDGLIQYELNYSYERVTAASQCYRTIGSNPSCYVDINSGGSGSTSGYGVLVRYGSIYCDLDTNTWALLTFTIIPVFFFRKKLFGKEKVVNS